MVKRTLELGILTTTKEERWSAGKESQVWVRAQKAVDQALKGVPKADRRVALDLDDSNLGKYIEVIRQLVKTQKTAAIVDATLEEESIAPPGGAAWYELVPNVELHDQGSTPESLPCIKADHIRPGVHAVIIIGSPPVVSDAFKRLVEKEKLKGLDYVPLADKSKRKAMSWYLPIPLKPIGRGLDHEFFDPAKLKRAAKNASNWMTTEPRWRTGVVRLDANAFKSDLTRDLDARPEAHELLSLVPKKLLRVSGARKYLRKFLPRGVDFAFSWTWPDAPPERGRLVSSRELCVSRRAMQALVDAKLVSAKEFKPLEIVDKPPAGVKTLDKTGDTGPGPLFEGEWRKRIDAAAKERERQAGAKPKLKSAPRSGDVLNLLRTTMQRNKDGFRKPAATSAIDAAQQKLRATLPEFWRDVLAVSDGFELPPLEALSGAAVSFDSTAELRSSLQKEMLDLYHELTGNKIDGHIYLGNTIWGDLFILRAGTQDRLPDAPTALVSHETGQDMANWLSTAAMLQELLSS